MVNTKLQQIPMTTTITGSPSKIGHPLQSMQQKSSSIDTASVTSSPTSTLSKQQKIQSDSSLGGGDHSNKTTVVLCPPSRTYCF